MKKNRLNLYTLDMKYVRNLAKVDDRVMSISPQEHKENRPFVGIIIIMEQKKYCVPLTSPKSKHDKMKNDLDFSKMFDKKNKFIGALNFNNMIPVSEDFIKPINITPNKNDSPKDKIYKELLNNQLDWCNDNIENIVKKANKLYKFVTQTPEKSRNLTRRCCNFKKLEEVLAKYTMKNNNNNKPDNNYYILIENEEQLEKLRNSNIPFKINKDKTVIIVDISDKERAKKCISEIQSKKNQNKPKL